jgi:iron(II)-dependent oxidoreductase
MALKLFAKNKDGAGGAGSAKGRRAARRVRPRVGSADDYQPAPVLRYESDPLGRMFQEQRYGAALSDADRWQKHPGADAILSLCAAALEAAMAPVPAGIVSIPQTLDAEPGGSEVEIEVKPFFLEVHPVTNARFQMFVDAGGYKALEYWPEDIWPHLIELKDLTGAPGPFLWRHGRHDQRLTDHPVVGISWYEAQAYALWVGLRLPTEAEWQMAASWSIKSSADILRRFPWGDSMDNTRCNIWSSRRGGTVEVGEYATGASPNHILQLVGNVWEWTDTALDITDENGRQIIGEMPMHVVRGGAYDTYFETQATSHFRTGLIALARAHNTGFRCALDADRMPGMADEPGEAM